MPSKRKSHKGSHVAAQVAGAWSAFDKARRDAQLQDSLQDIKRAFSAAMDEMQKVRDFVGSPESILGNPATKHGEIAEQVHVGVRRAFDVLRDRVPSATFEGVDRFGPVDYKDGGIDIQSKYIAGLRNTLDHILDHAERYPEFVRMGSYHIASDQHEQLLQLQETGTIDGSERAARTVQRQGEALQELTGREMADLVQPGEATYAEVQQGRIHDTIKSRERRIARERDELQQKARASHSPSIQGLGKATAAGAAAGGGVRMAQVLWDKWSDGKNPFRGDFSIADWKDIGIEGAKGAGGGAIAGGSLYLLTNATDLAAPFAGSLVSGLMGVGDLLRQYQEGCINGDQFVELSLFVASDAAIVGIATVAGQTLIPVPVLGAFIGSVSGQLVTAALKGSLGDSEQELASRLQIYETTMLEQLDNKSRSLLVQLDEYFGDLEHLLRISFDETVNTSLRLEVSVRFAETVGVPEKQIIRSTDNLDQFMTE